MSVIISQLMGLGPKAEKHLNTIGIYTRADLEAVGAVSAYLQLIDSGQINPHLNFLYAIVGALEDVSWLKIAQEQREHLLFELEGFEELRKLQNEKK